LPASVDIDYVPPRRFLALGGAGSHAGIIVLIRRKTRAAERAALIHLLDKAGETGVRKNINFA
jgi:hypothetical protein